MPASKITTLGIESQQMRIKINDMIVKVVLWDPAGQERFESMTKSFYQKLDGVLLVFDMTNDKSFTSLNKWLSQINEIRPCPYIIAGNKADLESQRTIDEDQIKETEERFNTQCIPTSAVTG